MKSITNWRPGSQTHEPVSDSWHLDRSSRVENALLIHVILKVSSHKVAWTSPAMWGFVMMFWTSLVSSGLCAKSFRYFGTSEDWEDTVFRTGKFCMIDCQSVISNLPPSLTRIPWSTFIAALHCKAALELSEAYWLTTLSPFMVSLVGLKETPFYVGWGKWISPLKTLFKMHYSINKHES